MRRLNMTIKKPNLPVDDIKVIVRPRDGFSTAAHRAARIGDSIRDAAGLRQEETRASAYAAAPENTTKGIIRGIPYEDSPEDIERHLVNEHNPTLLHAKRMGNTANAIVVFQGSVVPHYIYYNGMEHRCVL
ncbi:hypothetical protein MTO96_049918 [Rhipicephalus appendiculatus]